MKINYKPDYNGGGIVNLMSSIVGRFGYKTGYPALRALPADSLRKADKVVLLVLDGLGYEYLINHGEGSWIKENLISKMTSVFPSTTASSITTFATGQAPGQHAITGWFVYLRELGLVSKILFCEPRLRLGKFTQAMVDPKHLIGAGSLFDRIKANGYIVTPHFINKGPFSVATRGMAKSKSYKNLAGMIRAIKQTVKYSKQEVFISAYWPEFDHLCHLHGVNSIEVKKHFLELDEKMALLWKALKDKNVILLITADHGLINTPKEKYIEIKDHPKLMECLTLPLCGEPRIAYCYVHPDRVRQFKKYVVQELGDCCRLFSRAQLLNRGYFGLRPFSSQLSERVGDFIMVMKDDWCIKDFLLGEDEVFLKANHGGLSIQEMFVPLAALGLK